MSEEDLRNCWISALLHFDWNREKDNQKNTNKSLESIDSRASNFHNNFSMEKYNV